MAQGVTNSQLLELLAVTLANEPDEDFQTAIKYQNYEVCNRWFQSDRIQEEGGTEISRRITLTDTGTARMVRPYEKTQIGVVDIMKTITAPWVDAQQHFSISRKEMLRNRSKARLISLVRARRAPAKLDLANLIEQQAWGAPQNAADELNARGVPYYISMRDNGSSGQGFDGTQVRFSDGTTSRTKSGIDPTVDPKAERWANWAATYTDFNHFLIKQMRLTFLKCNFQRPTTVEETSKRPFTDFRIYMADNEIVEYEDLATSGNDNLGPDVSPYNGYTAFKRTPIIHAPVLDGAYVIDGTGAEFNPRPIYYINHGRFYPIVQAGEWMRENEPINDVEQHNVFTTFIDCEFQFFCDNIREGGAVLHKVIPAA